MNIGKYPIVEIQNISLFSIFFFLFFIMVSLSFVIS